jgi:hypothetical protein
MVVVVKVSAIRRRFRLCYWLLLAIVPLGLLLTWAVEESLRGCLHYS